jgi:outer membrane protein OmpA-like peptidoglycan-associated protein
MNDRRRIAALLATVAAGVTLACGPQTVRTPDTGPPDVIVLLPDSADGATGRAVVSGGNASVDLARAREFTRVAPNGPPAPVTVMSEAEVQRVFGDVLATLPPPAQHFTLFFRFESDELTEESRALVPQVLLAVKNRPLPEVAVVGHTDTTGAAASNFDLGLKRANTVRALLVEAGLDPSFIEVISHGEAELLVATPDDTYEARNRRVEISIR